MKDAKTEGKKEVAEMKTPPIETSTAPDAQIPKTKDQSAAPHSWVVPTVISQEHLDAAPPQSTTAPPDQSPAPSINNTYLSSSSSDPNPSHIEKKNKKLFFIGIFFLLLVLLASGAGFMLMKKTPEPEKIAKPVQVTASPTPTEAVKQPIQVLDKSEWTFEVLNGSGKVGAAKTAADQLEALGYVVVKTGNADKSTYESTELIVDTKLLEKSVLLLDDLKGDFTIATVSGGLKTDSTASAQIIIGKELLD